MRAQRDYRRADRIRAAICVTLSNAAEPMTVRQLVAALRSWGLALGPDSNKVVADLARTAVNRGQIRPAGRGTYAAGRIPASTLHYMRLRVDLYVRDPTQSYSRPDNYPPFVPAPTP